MKKISRETKKELCGLMDEREAVLLIKLNNELVGVTANFIDEKDYEQLIKQFAEISLNTIKYYKPENDIVNL